MGEIPQHYDRKAFVTDLSTNIRRRVENAEPIKLLSRSDNKQVELVRDVMGQNFVRRTYAPEALTFIEQSGFSFQDALTAMQRDFARAGLEITPYIVLNSQRKEGQPLIVASQYLENAKPVIDASTETKIGLARGLGNLLVRGKEILPQQQMLRKDMFHVVQRQNGEEAALLTDIDPYVNNLDMFNFRPRLKDSMTGAYINRVSALFYDNWTKADERTQVIDALVDAVAPIFNTVSGMTTLDAFSKLKMMEQGLDLR